MSAADDAMATPVGHGERVAYGVVAIVAGIAMYRFRGSLVKTERSSMRSEKGPFRPDSSYWKIRERILQVTGVVLIAVGMVLVVTGAFSIA